MSLPTGDEADEYGRLPQDTEDTDGSQSVAAESGSAIQATPEATERQVTEQAGEIVRMAQEFEIMTAMRAKMEAALKRVETTMDVMDGTWLRHTPLKNVPFVGKIPILPADAMIGLIPVVGDAATAAASLHIVVEARGIGMSWWDITKMLSIIIADFGIGLVPVIGDGLDYFFKSNKWNAEIFKKYVQKYVAEHEDMKERVARETANAQARKRFQDSRNLGDTPTE